MTFIDILCNSILIAFIVYPYVKTYKIPLYQAHLYGFWNLSNSKFREWVEGMAKDLATDILQKDWERSVNTASTAYRWAMNTALVLKAAVAYWAILNCNILLVTLFIVSQVIRLPVMLYTVSRVKHYLDNPHLISKILTSA